MSYDNPKSFEKLIQSERSCSVALYIIFEDDHLTNLALNADYLKVICEIFGDLS